MSGSHVFKYIDLRKTPSLELGLMLMCAYAPYGLAEGIHLSGIMAILFTGTATSRLLACFCYDAFCVLMLCRYRHVALHSQQPVSRHSSHCAATVANNSFHGGFVLRKHHKLCAFYLTSFSFITHRNVGVRVSRSGHLQFSSQRRTLTHHLEYCKLPKKVSH